MQNADDAHEPRLSLLSIGQFGLTVTIPAAEHRRHLVSTKLYCTLCYFMCVNGSVNMELWHTPL